MENKEIKRNKLLKILIQAILIITVVVLVYIAVESVLPGIIPAVVNGTKEDVQAYLERFHDFHGYAVCFVLQFIQIITIFLPSIPIQISAGIVFGVFKGFLVCFLGYVAANAVVFFAVRKLGASLEKWLPSPKRKNEKQEKRRNAILASDHPAFMVFLATTFPILPNGLIPYIAAKTRVRFIPYMLASSIGSIPTILTLCSVGRRIVRGDFLSAALITLPLLAFFLIMFWQQKNITKLYSSIANRIIARKEEKHKSHEGELSESGGVPEETQTE